MHHHFLKTGVSWACALAFVAAYGSPAEAVSRLSLGQAEPLVVQIVDQEDLSVEENMRPDEPPAALMDEKKSEKPMMEAAPEASEGGNAANIEDEMVDKIGPGAE
ncbi:MAG TPA: hypothetical protein VMW05_07835 [Methyloceanibacter sp.]|nr:hypothetical protein [Methyloceanibacter sp.]